jgi:hypothetical protein
MTSFSYTTGNPSNLTAGATASMNDIQGPFTDLRTFLNGANLDGTNIAHTTLGAYQTHHDTSGWVGAGTAGGTYIPNAATNGAVVAVASGVAGAFRMVYVNPSDYSTVTGFTPKLRVRLVIGTNATAPTSTFSAALFPITAFTGAAGLLNIQTVGAALGTTTTIVAPTASAGFQVVGSDFDPPIAGFYTLGLIIATSPTAANSAVNATITLQQHFI